MICRAPGALAEGMIHGVTLLNPVSASVRLIDFFRPVASALGSNASVSASQTPLVPRGNAATACAPAMASDGESIELLSSVESFVQPAAARAVGGAPTTAIVAASTSTDRDLRISTPFDEGILPAVSAQMGFVRVRRVLRAARCYRACAP